MRAFFKNFIFFLAYYVAFGPHGPRAPVNPPGTTVKVMAGVGVLIATAGLVYGGVRSVGAFCVVRALAVLAWS